MSQEASHLASGETLPDFDLPGYREFIRTLKDHLGLRSRPGPSAGLEEKLRSTRVSRLRAHDRFQSVLGWRCGGPNAKGSAT